MVKKALTLLTSILIALPLLMPFNIYASATHQVQLDYLSTVSTDWRNSMVFTSYCEGTNASTASCVLTVNITKSPKNYFGTVTIHGYDSSGTKWIHYGDIFVSSGTGVYNYNFYQNGIKEITRVEVYSTNLIQPSSTVDLSQIISLLTSINNYEQQNKNLLDDIVDNTDTLETNQLENIQQIKNVLSQLVTSNGYLDLISKLRQYDLYPESYSFVIDLLRYSSQYLTNDINYSYINYPVFNFNSPGSNLFRFYVYKNSITRLIFISPNRQIYGLNELSHYFYSDKVEFSNFKFFSMTGYWSVVSVDCKYTGEYNADLGWFIQGDRQFEFIPIYFGRDFDHFSTDFALQFGQTNKLLDDLHLIANGTAQSSSAASSNDLANEQLQTDSNTLFTQENGFKSDMQNAMQNVNNTFRLQDMGTKFVSSAQWVRTQYENLTNNTPFASLITFSLITGLALILLGKVYK